MNLELCRTFYFVANYGSISKAAEHLYLTQPAVSRAVKKLEEELRCNLFARTPKGTKLTQEGEILYQYVDQIFNFLSAADRKINEVRNLSSGEVRIGASDTLCKYYLIPYLKLFNTLHPAIKVNVTCPTTPGIIDLLKDRKIDFGIINMPFYDNHLNIKNLMEIQDCFVVGEKYKHLHYKMQPLREIVKYPILLLEKTSNSRAYIDQYFSKNSISVIPDFELGNIDLLAHFARYDFGVACVIKNFIEYDLDTKRLYEVKPIEKIPPRSIGVACLKGMPLPTAAAKLIDLLGDDEIPDI